LKATATRAWVVDSVQPHHEEEGVTVVRCVSKVEDENAEHAYFNLPDGARVPEVGAAVELSASFTWEKSKNVE
jgi:hypothetical protein